MVASSSNKMLSQYRPYSGPHQTYTSHVIVAYFDKLLQAKDTSWCLFQFFSRNTTKGSEEFNNGITWQFYTVYKDLFGGFPSQLFQ
uniref:Guanine nucleotide-exchange, putative n=1 Tax=Arundo donax TaxID=35708 RepID=A0A0A9D637_ARUDO